MRLEDKATGRQKHKQLKGKASISFRRLQRFGGRSADSVFKIKTTCRKRGSLDYVPGIERQNHGFYSRRSMYNQNFQKSAGTKI
jgi:hypothetical protein